MAVMNVQNEIASTVIKVDMYNKKLVTSIQLLMDRKEKENVNIQMTK